MNQSRSRAEGDARVSGVRIHFRSGFADVVVGTMRVLAAAARREGNDPWIEETYARLSEDLRRDLHEVFVPFGVPLILRELLRAPVDIEDYPSFIGWMTSIGNDAVRSACRDTLGWIEERSRLSGEDRLKVPDLSDGDEVRAFLVRRIHHLGVGSPGQSPDVSYLLRLLRDPVELKARLLFTVARFWEAHFKDAYSECARRIERSGIRHRQMSREGNFAELYRDVTGHALPDQEVDNHPDLRDALFIPSCFGGPVVNYIPLDLSRDAIALIYNCWPEGNRGDSEAPVLREMFPPLKALADETRLEILSILNGRELYAQEIVEELHVSQPAASRHLNLLVASGVLVERRERGRRFYTLNTQVLSTLSRSLTAFRSGGELEERESPIPGD